MSDIMLKMLNGFKEARENRVATHEKLNKHFKYRDNILKVIKGELIKLTLSHEKIQPSHAKIVALYWLL